MATNKEFEEGTSSTELNFKLCIKCQKGTSKDLSMPDEESYEKFLAAVCKRAEFGNTDFIALNEKIGKLSAQDLSDKKVVWHKTCYGNTVGKEKIARDEKRYQRACETSDVTVLSNRGKGRPSTSSKVTETDEVPRKCTRRSQMKPFNKNECFFCQGKSQGRLTEGRSPNIGKQIKDIVHNSNNQEWKVNYAMVLADNDVLACDFIYHKDCITTEWQSLMQGKAADQKTNSSCNTEDSGPTVDHIKAEIEFFAEIHDRISRGECIPMDEAERLYLSKMAQYNIQYISKFSSAKTERKWIRTKIEENVPAVQFTALPKKPALIHSKATQNAAVVEAVKHITYDDMKKLFEASIVLRKLIQEKKKSPWIFSGTLEDTEPDIVPQELHSMILWIIKGTATVKSEAHIKELNKSASIISQQIVQAHKSNRQLLYEPNTPDAAFRSTIETPITLGISLYCEHNYRNQKLSNLLSHAGVGVPYRRVKQCVAQISEGVQMNMEDNGGNYLPPGLHKNQRLRFSIDNLDANVDTYDGKNSFHATAMAVYQREPSTDETLEVTEYANPTQSKATRSLKDIPMTVIPLIPSSVTGAPKPNNSPQYPNFKLGMNEKEFRQPAADDLAWLLVRHFHRNDAKPTNDPADSHDGTHMQQQPVPVWTAYNSLLRVSATNSESVPLDRVHALPLINAPAHEWTTLTTALTQLCNLSKLMVGDSQDSEPILVWLDMDLYKRVRKLSFLDPQFRANIIPSPGAFHVVLCALRCLGATLESSGLDEAWVESGLYSSVTVIQILNGKHHNRALEAHQITLQVLFDLWIESFFKQHPVLHQKLAFALEDLRKACENGLGVPEAHGKLLNMVSDLKLMEALDQFDHENDKYPMYKWARTYMRQVNNLLQFIRSTRDGNWILHLASLEQMCIYFFAYNRHDYAQNIPDYIAHMYHLEHSHPSIWQDLKSGDFVVTTNPVPFTSIGPDHAQEHVNKIHKGEGAISGLTTDPQGLLKYCLSTPVMARLAGETEHLLNITDARPKKHHQLSASRNARQDKSVKLLKDVLSSANPFSPPENDDQAEMKLVNFVSKRIMPTAVQNSVLDMESRGRTALETHVNERVRGEKNMWDKMSKLKYLTWKDGCKSIKLKASSEVVSLKATNSLFVRLLLVAKSSRELDLQKIVGTHEFADYNASLMTSDGSLLPTTAKSALIHELEGVVSGTASPEEMQSSPSAQVLPSILIDGMAVVQEMVVRRGEVKCCRDLAECYIQSVHVKSQGYTDIYLLFDNYTVTNSMKDRTRQIRTAGRAQDKGYQLEDSTPIRDFKAFLGTKETKANLVLYLAQKAVELCKLPITTHTHKGVMSTNMNMVNITSTQEEADTLLVLYAVAVSRLGKTPHIYSGDTDVLVLALRRVPDLKPESAIIMGTGDRRRTIKLRPIYMAIGPERAAALPGFHTLTGCDTTGHIRGKGKSTCFKSFMKAGDDAIHALAELGVGSCPSSEVLVGCEKFLCQLFKPGYESAEALRWHMFKELKANQGVEKLFPTQGSITEHILRAHWQANVWAQDLVADPQVQDPLSLGWKQLEDGRLVPLMSKVPPAPEAVVDLVKCSCISSKCSGRCSCKANNLPCTELCKCEATEGACNNLINDETESDDDDSFSDND